MALFPVDQIQNGGRVILEIFEWPYLCNGSSDPLPVCSAWFSGSADRMSLLPVGPNSQPCCIILNDYISETIRSNSCLVLG